MQPKHRLASQFEQYLPYTCEQFLNKDYQLITSGWKYMLCICQSIKFEVFEYLQYKELLSFALLDILSFLNQPKQYVI